MFVPSKRMCWFLPMNGFMNSSMASRLVPMVFRNWVRWFFVRLRLG